MINEHITLLTMPVAVALSVTNAQNNQNHWQYVPTTPPGWNSWDIFGTTVTEQQIKEQADARCRIICDQSN
jgi:hypothetical protein